MPLLRFKYCNLIFGVDACFAYLLTCLLASIDSLLRSFACLAAKLELWGLGCDEGSEMAFWHCIPKNGAPSCYVGVAHGVKNATEELPLSISHFVEGKGWALV